MADLEAMNINTPNELLSKRPDADCVYGGSHYFFNINVHRTMILIEFEPDNEATILWAGSHDEYELTFKNNRNVIEKWLIDNRLQKNMSGLHPDCNDGIMEDWEHGFRENEILGTWQNSSC